MSFDRAVPFTLSLTLSQIQRIGSVLQVAARAGMLTSPEHRPNKLVAEFLMQQVQRLEIEYRATGLLAPLPPVAPAPPTALEAPTQLNTPAPLNTPTPLNAERLATDPDARARARAALGFNPAPPAAAPPPSPLPEPEGLDWSRVP